MEVINGIDANAAAQAAAHVLSRRDVLKLTPVIVEGGRQFIEGLKDLLSPQAEQLKNFSGYIIGESTVGSIASLTAADTQHSDLDSAVRRSAAKVITLSNTRGIPRLDSRNRLKTTIFNMNGITGNAAPLVILHETDTKGNSVGRAYLAFGLKKETVNGQTIDYLTVPAIDNVGILVALKQYEYPNGEIVLGVPDLEKPEEINTPIFVIKTEKVTDKDGNIITRLLKTSFLPPFAASSIGPIDAPKNTFTRVTVERARKQTETPAETKLPPEITERYIKQFESIETGKKTINSKETDVFYGVKKDGTKTVIAMEIETDREMRMTRVGEYTDEAGFSYYVMMDKTPKIDGSMGGRFNVTDDTAKKLFKIDTEKGAVNIWKSLGRQWGISPEAARDKVMIDNNGIAHFDVAVGIPTSNAKYPSKSESLPYPVNFNLPIKVNAIATVEDYNDLPDEIKRLLIVDLGLYKDSGGSIDAKNGDLLGGGSIFGSLIWASPDGQLTIYSVSTAIEHFKVLTPEKMDKDKTQFVNSYLKECINTMVGLSLDMLSKPNGDIPSVSFKSLYYTQLLNLFEVDGFINNSSQ